jgi:hypothetical protein
MYFCAVKTEFYWYLTVWREKTSISSCQTVQIFNLVSHKKPPLRSSLNEVSPSIPYTNSQILVEFDTEDFQQNLPSSSNFQIY